VSRAVSKAGLPPPATGASSSSGKHTHSHLPQFRTPPADFAVQICHEPYACRVRVAGVSNALEVLRLLSQEFVFRTSAPFQRRDLPAFCTFEVAYGSQLSHRELERLLTTIPGLRLTREEPRDTVRR
jgi:hypothetical protein